MKTIESPIPVQNRKAEKQFHFWQSVVALCTYALLLVCLLGRLGSYFFFFELFSHFSAQCLAIAGFLFVYWILFRNRLYAVALFSVLLNAWLVLPWVTSKTPAAEPADLRIMHTNVLFTNREYDAILESIRRENADLVLIAEATPPLFQKFRQELHREYPYGYLVYSKTHCYVAMGSRTPLRVNHAAVTANRMLHVHTTVKGREIALISVHPKTPLNPTWFESRNERLQYAFDQAAKESVPTILAGDFNVSVFSPVYRSLVASSGMQASRKGFGISPTYRNGYGPLMIPIDHVLTNKGFRTVGFRTLDMKESDHKAIVADLKFQ